MRVSSAAFRVFLATCLAIQHTEAAFLPMGVLPFSVRPESIRQPQRLAVKLQEQKADQSDGGIFGFIKKLQGDWTSSPESRRSLGIESDEDVPVSDLPKEPEMVREEGMAAEPPFMVEATGKTLPKWEPHPPHEAPPMEEMQPDEVEELLESLVGEREAEVRKEQPVVVQEEEVKANEVIQEDPIDIAPPTILAEMEAGMEWNLEEPLITKETTEQMSKATIAVVEKVVNPIIGPDIEKGVPFSTIQSAAFSCGLFALIMSGGDVQVAAGTLISVAIISITPGPVGDVLRTIGDWMLDTMYRFSSLSNKLGVTDIVSENLARIEYGSKVEKLKTVEQNLQLALELAEANLAVAAVTNMEKAESMQASVAQVLREADQVIANALQIQKDKLRLAEEELLGWRAKADQTDKTLIHLVKEANRLAQEAEDLAKEGAALRTLMDKSGLDVTIPYDAPARLAYESSGKLLDYEAFKIKYNAEAVADVIAKRKPDLSIPYDAAAMLAYAASDKTMSYEDFKTKYEAEAVVDVVAKKLEREERLALEARRAEEARIAAAKREEEIRQAKELEARIAEEERIAAEKREEEIRLTKELQARIAEEERIAAEKREEEIRLTKELEARIAEEERVAEEKRQEEIRLTAELNARIAEEVRIAAEKREEEIRLTKELEARIAEEERVAAEKREEEIRLTKELEARIAEEERIAEEKRQEEKARLNAEFNARTVEDRTMAYLNREKDFLRSERRAEERLADEARWAAAQRRAEDEEAARLAGLDDYDDLAVTDDDSTFPDDDWERTLDLAKGNVDGIIVGIEDADADEFEKAGWDAAGKLAQELGSPPRATPVFDDEDAMEFGVDIDIEELARAAREAVEKYEMGSNNEDAKEEVDFDVDFFDIFDDDAAGLDDIAAAARNAVDIYETTDFDDDSDMLFDEDAEETAVVTDEEPMFNWSSLKVSELKAELKSRGLPTAGKKTDLVAMLEKSDIDRSASLSESEGTSKSASGTVGKTDFTDMDLEEIGRAAREAAALFEGEEPSDEVLMMLENEELGLDDVEDVDAGSDDEGETVEDEPEPLDYSSMTVNELKEELRSRGLKVSGKKEELMARLRLSG